MQGSDPGELQPAPDRVDNGPAGTRFSEVRRFSEVDSTNRYLLDLARLRPLQGVVAVADHQTAGRGRQGRRWQAPRGTNLLMSVLLVPDLPADQLYLCTAAAALAAADACRELAGLQPSLKWPNDLVVGKRKLAGILAESVPLPDGGRRVVVVGLGLNVEWPPPDAGSAGFSATARRGPTTGFEGPGLSDFEPEDTSDPAAVLLTATSIRRETGVVVDKARLLDVILNDLDQRLAMLGDEAGRARLAGGYRQRCATIGQHVVVVTAEGEYRGVALDVTPEGHLVVDAGACFRTVSAGDVIHLRADR